MNCKRNPTIPSMENVNYVPMHVGDIRQLVDPADSSTYLLQFIGTRKRSDGQEMFVETWKRGISDIDTSYWFVREGYWIYSELDSSFNSSQNLSKNPYSEQRLSLESPKEDLRWIIIPGDTTSMYMMTINLGKTRTLCDTFYQTYGMGLIYSLADTIPWMIVKYAPNIGWIGTWVYDFYKQQGYDAALLSYAKVGGNVIGRLWPDKNSDNLSLSKKTNGIMRQLNFLGVSDREN
jgi:hypothetical protein